MSLKEFETDFRSFLELKFNNSKQDDAIQKLAETERSVLKYMDQYIQNSDVPLKNMNQTAQYILNEFSKEKLNVIK